MNRAALNIMAVCQKAVRTHAKGNDETDAEIAAGMERTVPGTIESVVKACASGAWAPIPHKSRAGKLEEKRAKLRALAAPPEATVVPVSAPLPAKTGKKK